MAWNPNTETNLAGYRLYYGTVSRQYARSNSVPRALTTSTVTNLSMGVKYYFAVTAVSVDGLESDYSDEVSYTVPSPSVPVAPLLTEALVMAAPAPAPISIAPVPIETENVIVFNPDYPLLNVAGDELPVVGPRIEIAPVGSPAVAFRLEFETPQDRLCELQFSSDAESWFELVTFPTGSTAQRTEFFDLAGPADSRRFYRLVLR